MGKKRDEWGKEGGKGIGNRELAKNSVYFRAIT
jgi:hypothetical protein